mmetsp:Transcript_11762/g.21138  ORF Transcript_11762/g.21138 Transcript_11762/m.21138 type:complete len:207 (+) Transcript_11762:267-887(+)
MKAKASSLIFWPSNMTSLLALRVVPMLVTPFTTTPAPSSLFTWFLVAFFTRMLPALLEMVLSFTSPVFLRKLASLRPRVLSSMASSKSPIGPIFSLIFTRKSMAFVRPSSPGLVRVLVPPSVASGLLTLPRLLAMVSALAIFTTLILSLTSFASLLRMLKLASVPLLSTTSRPTLRSTLSCPRSSYPSSLTALTSSMMSSRRAPVS